MIKEISNKEWQSSNYSSLGSFWDRTFATLIDALIIAIPFVAIELTLEYTIGIELPFIIKQIAFLIYPIIWHWKRGVTIGKKNFELRVENVNGEKITLEQSIKREAFTIFSIICYQLSLIMTGNKIEINNYWTWIPTIVSLVDIFWLFSNNKNQTLHDIFAKTYCKKK